VVAGLSLVLLIPLASGTSPDAGWSYSPGSWSNGLVLCDFADARPWVTVSALSLGGTGIEADLGSVLEETSDGVVVSHTDAASAVWTAQNLSGADAYDIQYSAKLALASVAQPSAPPSWVYAQVEFILPAYSGTEVGAWDTVTMHVGISNWSWEATGDHLEMEFTAWPSNLSTERLTLERTSGVLVSSVDAASGAPLEDLSAAGIAAVDPGTPQAGTVSASPVVAANGSSAEIAVAFGADGASFSALNYSAEVRVLIPPTVAGIPTIDLVAAGGAGALIAVLIAAGAHRIRRRPSDLTYMKPEEP
jgi:hypothetical protein